MKRYFVVGNPIGHSLSPKLHNYWIKKHNINAKYEKKKLDEIDLKKVISEVRDKKIDGINVTVPFKNKIIPFLDKLTIEAAQTQSVNTVYMNGKEATGHNTDIEGFSKSIINLNINLTNKIIFILGAGGVVPSIIFALKKMGASKIIISNRTKKNAEKLTLLFDNLEIIDWGEVPYFDATINATSVGLNEGDEIGLDFSKVGKNKLFYDVIYNPSKTNFLEIGKKLGNIAENGKLMFIYQALSAFNLWHKTNLEVNKEAIKILEND